MEKFLIVILEACDYNPREFHVKFYSSNVVVDNKLSTKYEGMYAIGDGAGITRGLMQASISGVVAARDIISRMEK